MALPGPLAPSDCFQVILPRGREVAVVVEVPHAGLLVDAEGLASLQVSARSLAKDADLYVDELVTEAPDAGATVIVARTSRYFVDLNRAEYDHDGHAVDGSTGFDAPHGVVWHRSTEGDRALRAPLTKAELERRLNLVHRPYHATLEAILADKKRRFGRAILVCAHSMPSMGYGLGGREVARADIVPGTRGRSSAEPRCIEMVERVARARGYSVRHDDPYRGGYSTGQYGVPTRGVDAVQIEVARRLYMSESSLLRNPEGVTRLRRFYAHLVAELGALTPPSQP